MLSLQLELQSVCALRIERPMDAWVAFRGLPAPGQDNRGAA